MPLCTRNNGPHDPILYPARRTGLLDLIAYLAYEAACATGKLDFGCLGLGVLTDTSSRARLFGAVNSGADFKLDFSGGKLRFNGNPIGKLLLDRAWDIEIEYGSMTDRDIKYMAMDRRLPFWEEEALEEKIKIDQKTTWPHHSLLEIFLKGAETALNKANTQEADLYRKLLTPGVETITGVGTMHAEMRILEKVEDKTKTAYIATDKVCCYSCYYMMRPYLHKKGILAFDGGEPLMGTHGHIFANWTPPTLANLPVDTSVACRGCNEQMLTPALGNTIKNWKPSTGNVNKAGEVHLKVQNADFIEVLELYED